MSESYLRTQEAVEQEDAATWLAENYFFGEDIGEADWTDYLKNVGKGTAIGFITGGPLGGVTGAGTAAYQTYQPPKAQPSAPHPPQMRPSAPPLVPVASPTPAGVATPGPAMTVALPQAAGSPQVASAELSKQVERVLGEVLPKMLQQFLAQQSQQGVAKEAIAEDMYGEIEGDYFVDDVFPEHGDEC